MVSRLNVNKKIKMYMVQYLDRKSVVSIWSATFRTAEMVARNPGSWLIQCMNSEHNRSMIFFLSSY